jgi:hypothetical protein
MPVENASASLESQVERPGRIRFNRTAVTAPLFNCLAPDQCAEEMLVSRIFASWNQLDGWLRQVEALRAAA